MAIYNFEEQKPKEKKADYQKIVGCILVGVSIVCLFCSSIKFNSIFIILPTFNYI